MFSEEDYLLNESEEELYGNFQTRRIGSYVNSGLLMKMLSGIVDEVNYYNIFIGFSIFIFFLSGVIIYHLLCRKAKNKYSKILALIVTLIAVGGELLTSLCFGFEYLSLGILIFCSLLLMVHYFEEDNFKTVFYLIMFALLNFGLFCSYYMFIPFTYSALWIYFCIYSRKKNKKILCKENITLLTCTLLVPFFLGFIYHFAPYAYGIFGDAEKQAIIKNSLAIASNLLENSFKLYGYTYVNYYSNMIPFIPLLVYYLIKQDKQKEMAKFDIIVFIFLALYIALLFILGLFGQVSAYFLTKNYYILWCLLIYMNFKGLMYIFDKSKLKATLILSGYVLLIIVNLIFNHVNIDKVRILGLETNLTEVFGANKTLITEKEPILDLDAIEVIKYAKKNIDFSKNDVEYFGNTTQGFWAYSLFRYINYEDWFENKELNPEKKIITKLYKAIDKVDKVDYMIFFKKNDEYQEMGQKLLGNGKIIFENDSGGIIKYEKADSQ